MADNFVHEALKPENEAMEITDYFYSVRTKFFDGDEIGRNWLLLLLINISAAIYVWFVYRTRSTRAARRAAFSNLVVFLTIQSWLWAFLCSGSDVSIWLAVFAVVAAPLILLLCSFVLATLPRKSVYDWIALATGLAYTATLVLLFMTGALRIGC